MEQVSVLGTNYFEDIFTTSAPQHIDTTLEFVPSMVSADMNRGLLLLFTEEETKSAVFQMHPSKAPGPDGMSSLFFQKYWNIMGTNVIAGVLSVLTSGYIL